MRVSPLLAVKEPARTWVQSPWVSSWCGSPARLWGPGFATDFKGPSALEGNSCLSGPYIVRPARSRIQLKGGAVHPQPPLPPQNGLRSANRIPRVLAPEGKAAAG